MKFIFVVLLAISTYAKGCTFFDVPDIFENGRRSKYVLVGKFVDYQVDVSARYKGIAKIEILELWKGMRKNQYFYVLDNKPNDHCASSFNPAEYDVGTVFLFAISKFYDNKVGFYISSESYRQIKDGFLVVNMGDKNGGGVMKISTLSAKKIIKNKGFKPR